MAYEAWNPSDKNASIVILDAHNRSLGFSGSDGAFTSSIRSMPAIANTVLVYAEFTLNSLNPAGDGILVGVMDASATLANYVGFNTHSGGFQSKSTGQTYYRGLVNAVSTNYGTAPVAGDIICLAVDPVNAKIWMRINNGNWLNAAIGSQDPASNLGGLGCGATVFSGNWYLAATLAYGTDVLTANFGPSFAYTPPAGFAGINTAATARVSQVAMKASVRGTTARVSQVAMKASVKGTVARVSQVTMKVSVPYTPPPPPVGPWPAVATAGGPALVQKAYARGNSNQTVTFGAAATAGNLLLAIQSGYNQSLTPPAGFTSLYDGHADETYNGTQAWTKTAAGGETSFAFTGFSDYHNVDVYEISNAGTITASHGQATASGNTITIGSLATKAATVMRFAIAEEDGSNNYAGTDSGTLFKETQNTPSSGNHRGVVVAIDGTTSGTLTLPWGGAPSRQVYGLIDIAAGAGGGGSTARKPAVIIMA